MSLCGIGVRTTNGTINQAQLEIIPGAGRPLSIFEIGILTSSGVMQTMSIGRPEAIGQTPTSPVLFQRDDPAEPACLGATALAWGVMPTSPLFFMRTLIIPANVGHGVIFTFPGTIVIPVTGTLVIWNTGATVANDVNILADEI